MDWVENRRDQLEQLTSDLVRIPTVNPPGENYRQICELLASRLQASGFVTEFLRATGTPGDSDEYPRWNLWSRREGGSTGDTVHFNGHIDVVSVGSDWTRDPFGGSIEDGKLFGRGSCDMKGGIAAAIVAAEAFIGRHADHPGAIEFSATADEESGGFGGVAYLAGLGRFAPDRVQHVIIPEPLGKDRVCLGHRGVWWAEIETKGRIAHGSMPFLGDCAIRHMGAFIAELEASLFPSLATRNTSMPVVPVQARQSTLNINSVHGGEAEIEGSGLPAPCVPDRCRLVIDRRYLIEEEPEHVRREIIDILEALRASRPGFAYEIRELQSVEPVMTDRDAPVSRAVSAAISQVLHRSPDYVASPGTYDQKHIDRIGRMKNCIAYGPGILELAHQPDEWIGVDDMLDSAKVMALTLEKLLLDG